MADGVPIELGTRGFDLLLALVEADGSLVTKEELMSRVWPGIVVAEENLKVQISALRKALGEDRDFIRTEFGRGYRFTAAVRSTLASDACQRPTRRKRPPIKGLFPNALLGDRRTVHPEVTLAGALILPRLGATSCRYLDQLSREKRRGTVKIRSFPAILDQSIGQSIAAKMPLSKAVALAAGLGLSMLSYPVHAAPTSSGDTVQGLYDALLSTMKSGRTLGQSGRCTQLEPVIRRSFDIASMARLSVGPSWAGLTEAQRQQMTESFGRYISAIYADRFDSYTGQKLEVTGEQPAPFGVIVRSRIIKANGEPLEVDYMMRRNGESWLISDVYCDGAISDVAARRSEFAAILKKEGTEGLIAALNGKANILTVTAAGSL